MATKIMHLSTESDLLGHYMDWPMVSLDASVKKGARNFWEGLRLKVWGDLSDVGAESRDVPAVEVHITRNMKTALHGRKSRKTQHTPEEERRTI